MKLVLYSKPDNGVIEKLENEIFHEKGTVFGYMPADGNDPKPQYTSFWQSLVKKHNAKFVYIDNSKNPTKTDLDKISEINSLAVMGGNVFNLLHNIRTNGYDKIIRKLSEKEDFIYSGFSAGAIIATPDIRIAGKEHGWAFGYDENESNITDTKALGFVDFEILPHYDPSQDAQKLTKYRRKFSVRVRPLTDWDFMVFEENETLKKQD